MPCGYSTPPSLIGNGRASSYVTSGGKGWRPAAPAPGSPRAVASVARARGVSRRCTILLRSRLSIQIAFGGASVARRTASGGFE